MSAVPSTKLLLTHALVALSALVVGFVGARLFGVERSAASCGASAAVPSGRGVRTWPEAQAEARARDLPVLLLLAPPHHRCPPARSLMQRLLEGEGLAQISAGAVPARLEVNERLPSAEASALLARLGRITLPCLVVVGPKGNILHRQFARLYPAYDPQGNPLADDSAAGLLDASGVVALVDAAVGRGRREARLLGGLLAAADPSGWVDAALLLERRGVPHEALTEVRRAVAGGLSPEDALRAARLLARLGAPNDAVAAIEGALGAGPTEPARDRLALLYDRLVGLPRRVGEGSALPTLDAVWGAAGVRGDTSVMLEARARIASAALARGESARMPADLAWCRQHLGALPEDSDAGVAVLEDLQQLAQATAQPAEVVLLLREAMRRYPEHPAAQDPKHGVLCEAEEAARLR